MSQDLVRIRENQRRSRARRKDYLKEIETRWRGCESRGAEASIEIQVAARNVAEENKRLRALLRQNGIQDSEIDSYLGLTNNMHLKETRDARTSPTVQVLEQKLSSRINCGGQAPTGDQAGCTRSSTERPQIITNPTVSFVASKNSRCRSSDALNSTSNELSQSLPLCSSQVDVQDTNQEMLPNFNNCTIAADMITTMAGGDSNSVKADLGCQPGIDCEVDNQLIFSVMDRYTGKNFTT